MHTVVTVVNGQTGRYGTAGRIDIQTDFLFRVLRFEEKELRADERGHGIVDLGAEQDDTILEQPGIDVIGAFGAACGFDDDRDKGHRSVTPCVRNADDGMLTASMRRPLRAEPRDP